MINKSLLTATLKSKFIGNWSDQKWIYSDDYLIEDDHMKFFDFSVVLGPLVVLLEFVLVVLMGRLNHLLDRQSVILDKIEESIDEEFDGIEQRLSSLFSDLNGEIRELTRDNYRTRELFRAFEGEVVEGLKIMKESVVELSRANIELSKKMPQKESDD